MADLKPEVKEKHLQEITKLVEYASPTDGSAGQGTLAGHFTAWKAQQKDNIIANGFTEEELNRLTDTQRNTVKAAGFIFNPNIPEHRQIFESVIKSRIPAEKKRLIETYMGGVTKAAPQADGQSGEMVKEAANLMGFGDGWMGWLAGKIGQIPVVGELVIAGFNVITSGIGYLLAQVGLGDPKQKFIDFTEALETVRESQHYANGANALGGIQTIGSNNAGILAELKAGWGKGGPLVTVVGRFKMEGLGPDGKTPAPDKNMGVDKSAIQEILLTVQAKDANGKTIKHPGATKISELIKAPSKLLDAYKDKKFMAVTMSDGTVALVSGNLDQPLGLNMEATTLHQLGKDAEGKVTLVSTPLTKPLKLPTGKVPPPLTLEQQVATSQRMPSTLSDNPEQMKNFLNKINREIGSAKEMSPDDKLKRQQELTNFATALIGGIKNKGEAIPAEMKSVLTKMPDQSLAIISGTYDPYTNKLTPLYITTQKQGVQETKKLEGKQEPVVVQPDYSEPTTVIKPIASVTGLGGLLHAMQNKKNVELLAQKLGASKPQQAALDNLKEVYPNIVHTVAALPGGTFVIVSGIMDSGNNKDMFQPIYETTMDTAGNLSNPKMITADRAKPYKLGEAKDIQMPPLPKHTAPTLQSKAEQKALFSALLPQVAAMQPALGLTLPAAGADNSTNKVPPPPAAPMPQAPPATGK